VDFLVRKETNAWVVPNAALRWSPSSLAQIVPELRSKIQPDPPGDSAKAPSEAHGVIWLKDGDYVRPRDVNIGATDGVNTAITGDTLQEGAQVVTGTVTAGAETTESNPFLPSRVRW
jgi:hypothetical protein